MKMQELSRKTGMLLMIVAALVLLSSTVSAIGISPATRIFDYEPGKTVTYTLDVVNNGHEDLEVIIYPRGDFLENIRLEHQMVTLTKDEESKTVNLAFIMPDKMERAGPREIEIVAVGTTPSPEGEQAIVKADAAVISKLVIDVPYPDKYAEARVYVLDTEVGKPVQVSIPVFNKGSQTINEAYADIEIYSSDGTKVYEMTTEKQTIKPGKDTKFTAQTAEGLEKGEYKAVATVHYDDKQIVTETMFSVGELSVDIKSLVVDKFTLGSVARFDILLYNSWSTELKNIYAEMQITDQENNVYTDFKTVATDIPGRQIGRLEGYWNTDGVMPGVYYARINLYYANRVSQKLFELEVYPDRIIARDAFTGQAITSQDELNLKNNAYLILLVLAMAVIIGVLAFRLKRLKKGGAVKQNTEIQKKPDKPVEKTIEKTPKAEEPAKTDKAGIVPETGRESNWEDIRKSMGGNNG